MKFLQQIKQAVTGKRGLSFLFSVASLVFAVVTLILYVNTGIDEFTTSLSAKFIALLIVFCVLAVIFSVCEIKLGKYAMYLVGFWAWLEYIISQVNYLANILVSIDGSTFSAAFICTVLFGALAWVCALVSAILQKQDIGSAKADTAGKA